MEQIYQDIARRTGGNIYIGVVGPVRTGKSTLIKRIMEVLVIPSITDPYRKERARDELPQSGSGRMIMTSEPKFVPEEAVEISTDGKYPMRLRMIDSVGYMVDGAVGATDEGIPRMVTTPWFDYEIPMTEAAELGTKKVMEEHCSIGLVVTTDGTVTDIQRQDYIQAERRAIADMTATGKPFLVVINSREPEGAGARAVQARIREEFSLEPMIADCQALEESKIREMLARLLYVFPMQELRICLPRWMDVLPQDHPVKATLYEALLQKAEKIRVLAEAQPILEELQDLEHVQDYTLRALDPATGTVTVALTFPESLFYEVLSSRTGMEIGSDVHLMQILTDLSQVKKEYDKIADALSAVKTTGYGVVMPRLEEMELQKPEVLRKNGAYGVKMKAKAPSIHMMRVDIDTEIAPMVGDEKQSLDLVNSLTGESPEKLWQSNIFGRSVYDLLQDGLNAKVVRLPEEVRSKFRGTLGKIVNEGATGLICIIL